LLYGLYAVADWAGLSLAVAALATLAFVFVYRQSVGNPFLRAFGVVWGAITSSVVWVARPQIISFFLAALVAYLLDRYKRHDGRTLWWLPLIVLIWANVHGGYAIAFILMLCYVIGEGVNWLTLHREDPVFSRRQMVHLLVVMGISILVVGINPNTWQMWVYPFRTVGIGVLRDFIQEWQSPNFHLAWQQPFIILLLLTVLALTRSGRRADFTHLALLAVWTMMSLLAGRNIAIFAIVAVPIFVRYGTLALERQLADWEEVGWMRPLMEASGRPLAGGRMLSLLNWLLLTLIIVAALVKIYFPLAPGVVEKSLGGSLPGGAVAYVQAERPSGPMFNSYNWGGYLLFTLWPDYQVFVDGRTDLYDDAFLRQYLSIHAAEEGWQQSLDEYGIQLVIVETNSMLAKFLRLEPSWQEAYRDETAAVFVRETE
jgi:signal transduction histidine kinase